MGKIFCVMGKSSTGKDTIYKKILENSSLSLERIITYTTRPIRQGEQNGVEYFFTDEEGYKALLDAGKIVEERVYNTVYGPWRYFTVDDENIRNDADYIVIGTLEAYSGLKKYFGEERVCPIFVTVDDGVRLQRALDREKQQNNPKYEELCRRFLADAADFSTEKINEAGINKFFYNNDLQECIAEIIDYIKANK